MTNTKHNYKNCHICLECEHYRRKTYLNLGITLPEICVTVPIIRITHRGYTKSRVNPAIRNRKLNCPFFEKKIKQSKKKPWWKFW